VSSPILPDGATPSPELFFDTAFIHQRTAALKAAVDLDVFSAIHDGAHTVQDLAARRSASERGMRILCDYLTIMGFLTKSDGQYRLTTDSAVFLTKQSPAYLGGTLQFLCTPNLLRNFSVLADTIRRGAVSADGNTVADANPIWEEFARAMAPMMIPAAQGIADILNAVAPGPLRVLDIAAGHGIFGITIAERNPSAQVTAVDWPNVLAVATENARTAGVADRHRLIPGDAFKVDYGTGYDVALVTNFVHHFDRDTNVALLKKVAAALTAGGRVVILEMVPNDDRISPPLAAGFALTMLAGTPAGDAFTLAELQDMLSAAGFGPASSHALPGPETIVVASRRST
jgi:2-polyprenyl-3-methyl-5-hydroxy-6-metoxy-1,4-benzoquinol methylase